MSSREITGTILRTCFGVVRKEATSEKLLEWALEGLASVERDMDKCGDMEDHAYYAGMSDAFRMVAAWIAPLKEDKSQFYHDLMGLKRPEEIVAEVAS